MDIQGAGRAEIVATLLDDGIYLCSARTMYRLLAARAEVKERRSQRRPRRLVLRTTFNRRLMAVVGVLVIGHVPARLIAWHFDIEPSVLTVFECLLDVSVAAFLAVLLDRRVAIVIPSALIATALIATALSVTFNEHAFAIRAVHLLVSLSAAGCGCGAATAHSGPGARCQAAGPGARAGPRSVLRRRQRPALTALRRAGRVSGPASRLRSHDSSR